MATQTPVPVSSTTPQQDKQEVREEVKTIIENKESGKEEKAKVEAMPSVESKENIEAKQNEPPTVETSKEEKQESVTPSLVAPSTESKENIEDKKIEPPVIEEVKKNEQIEKPIVENSPSPPSLLTESKENVENKQIEPLVTNEDVKEVKIEDKPIVPPVIEQLKKEDEVEKSNVDLPCPAVILDDPKESSDKPIESPVKEKNEEPVLAEPVLAEPVLAVTNKLPEQPEVAEEIKKETEEKSPVIEPKEISGAEVEKSETENSKTETKEAEDVPSSITVPEVTERSLDLESEKEVINDEAALKEPAEKEDKPDVDVKANETEKTDETKVLPKSTQKSNTILAKMKQSLIKAKKAIIGKSTTSKSPSSETKGEVKV